MAGRGWRKGDVERRAGLTGLNRLALIVDPAGGHNVVARTPCIDDVRIRWLDNPTRPPPDDCLGAERIRWDLP